MCCLLGGTNQLWPRGRQLFPGIDRSLESKKGAAKKGVGIALMRLLDPPVPQSLYSGRIRSRRLHKNSGDPSICSGKHLLPQGKHLPYLCVGGGQPSLCFF